MVISHKNLPSYFIVVLFFHFPFYHDLTSSITLTALIYIYVLPRSGTFGMESVARQFAYNQHSMVLRNGWFSYRWTEILDMMTGPCTGCTKNTTTHTVLSAQPVTSLPSKDHVDDIDTLQPQYEPMPIEQVVEYIHKERPAVFFCPHVETSTGIILPDSYIQQIATAMQSIQGLLDRKSVV